MENFNNLLIFNSTDLGFESKKVYYYSFCFMSFPLNDFISICPIKISSIDEKFIGLTSLKIF